MKKSGDILMFVLIILLFGALIIDRFVVNEVNDKSIITETVIDDSVYVDTTIQEISKPDSIVYKDTTIYEIKWRNKNGKVDTFWKDVDTNAIIKDYLSNVYGHHVLKDDSMAYVAFDYRLRGNRLIGINNVKFQNRTPTIINTQKIYEHKSHLYIGGGARVGIKTTDLSIKLFYTKPKVLYFGGYWFQSNTLEVGAAIKIK